MTELDIIRGLVAEIDATSIDSAGRWPQPDEGCIECTVGTVPNDRNTGLCAYHQARAYLRKHGSDH